jgi:hypothetical protein
MSLRKVFSRMTRLVGRKDGRGYYPERHYMRGAGPAWHRKQAGGAI